MAPRSHRQLEQNTNETSTQPNPTASNNDLNDKFFLDPMLGTPLAIYIEKDVEDRSLLADIITRHGGIFSQGYSGVPYILVDPNKKSGQNLWRQYAGKKGKIVLNSRWVHECLKAGALQTFHHNWAGCKVTGTEMETTSTSVTQSGPRRQDRQDINAPQVEQPAHQVQPSQTLHQAMQQPTISTNVDPLLQAQSTFSYPIYPTHISTNPRGMHPATSGPPPAWQAANGIAPQQTHIQPPPHLLTRSAFREESWEGYDHPGPPAGPMVGSHQPAPGYDYRYREDQAEWVPSTGDYYDPSYDQTYDQQASYMNDPGPSSTVNTDATDRTRGRKRTRVQPTPAPPASSLVINRRHHPARSPTPPTRVIKSTYGGNLFTSDDIQYLKKYIDYCQEQGLVLSLREICERIAVKAPHHSFYSWRRYCNRHQIKLGGYAMANRATSPQGDDQDQEEDDQLSVRPSAGIVPMAQVRAQRDGESGRNRSPTPPRALFRSTAGKGVAFTDEDVTFLVRFMEYRRSQGRLDMVAFWKDVALKAPHHSRASWMKFWRRHKHEFNRTETDEPLPQPPEKKLRYSQGDDILLAKYFFNKPEGISDKIFQAFGRLHPHHPWKGWQEHHRIHKAKIDHFIKRLANGENIDGDEH